MIEARHADDGELKFLRWQDPGCLGCSDNRCVQTGIVYDEKPTFSCTPASTEDCTSGANDVDNFECAPDTARSPLAEPAASAVTTHGGECPHATHGALHVCALTRAAPPCSHTPCCIGIVVAAACSGRASDTIVEQRR